MLLLTAVRAGILSLFVIYFASIFLAKKRIVFKLFFSFIVILIMLVAFAIVGGDFFIVLEDRIKNSGDGRLTIWRWYLELLSENLMGFGYAFEEIVNTSQVNTFELNRQRLTPHNAFINAWVYAGFLGFIFVCFYVFSALLNIFKLLANRNTTISYELHGASLAWVGLITILFFGGQIFGDPFSAILISILASGIHKFKNLKN